MRYQRGRLYHTANGWYVQYRNAERKQLSQWLCGPNVTAVEKNKAWLAWQAQFNGTEQPNAEMQVAEFWEKHYLPFAESKHRPTTVEAYRIVWNKHLGPHFANRTLQTYRASMGTEFLLGITPQLAKATVLHIKSLATGIFSHAAALGKVNANPWREVKVLGKPRATAGTGHYTREEMENVHNALLGRTDCQLVMALGYFAGLRIGEIAGLQWGDIDTHIHIRRGIHRRRVSLPKTEGSERSVPLIEPIITLLREHHRTATSEWVFPNEAGKPMDMELLSRRVIRPMLKAANLPWKGYHATRRGAGTQMMKVTGGNIGAVQMFLGHSTATTTAKAYIKKNPDVLEAGMKLLEAASAVRAIKTEGDAE